MLEINKIYNIDCLEGMKQIDDKSIDCIICDLPYETLNKSNANAQWDKMIPFDRLWEQYERIIKDAGAIILFCQGMFTAQLMMSKPGLWRYNLIWKKGNRSTGFLNAKKMPLRNHEDIAVFYKKQPTYNPQKWQGAPNHSRGSLKGKKTNQCYGDFDPAGAEDDLSGWKYPISIIDIDKEHDSKSFHPTQKPVELLRYLIRTYSNPGDLILDNCMGSGTTAVAAIKEKRRFIGFELDENYYEKAVARIKETFLIENSKPKSLFD